MFFRQFGYIFEVFSPIARLTAVCCCSFLAGEADQVEQRAPRGGAALDRSLDDSDHAQPEDQAPRHERASRAPGANFMIDSAAL